MATTYEAIATVTVGSGGAANIEFTSIPATYTDLVIKGSFRGTGTSYPNMYMDINSVTTNRSLRWLQGDGSGSVNSYSFTIPAIGTGNSSSQTANTFNNYEIYFPNYTNGNNKSFSVDSVTENNASNSYLDLIAGLWSNASAITSLKLYINGQNLAQYSTATLYGIKNS